MYFGLGDVLRRSLPWSGAYMPVSALLWSLVWEVTCLYVSDFRLDFVRLGRFAIMYRRSIRFRFCVHDLYVSDD